MRFALTVLGWAALVLGTPALGAPPNPPVTAPPAVAASPPPATDPDAVLKLIRTAMQDIIANDRPGAADTLDRALAIVESTHGAGPEAAKARSLWYEEGCKIFKGEPYERCMMYYYRGLLYLWKKDYGNAHACFANGILQDAFAEEEQDQCDFGLLYFLSVYTASLSGQNAQDDEKDLARLRPDAPKIGKDGAVLVICETGKAPRKLSDGVGHYELKFFRGKNFRSVRARLKLADGTTLNAYPMEDIAFQAMTRGSRPIDFILEHKAQFRENTSIAGSTLSTAATAAILASTVVSKGAGTLQIAGGAMGVASALLQMAASASKPQADVRTWDNLPDTVHVALVDPALARQGITVEFLAADGSVVASTELKADPDSNVLWCRNSD